MVIQRITFFLFPTGLICAILFLASSIASALDANPRVQDRYSSTSTVRVVIFPAALEQTVSTLQNQIRVQAQLIAQLKQVICINSSGTVTIQALGTINMTAGGTVKLSGSKIDMNAPITSVHGILKADTMMTTTVIAQTYTPGAGNIW